MDDHDNPLITTKIPGAMNYPSTTQALFALIVMIIVLLFILVYCCWGTFSCSRLEDSSHTAEDGAVVVREIQGPGGRGSRMVIVPFSNMIYVGDPESRRIYEIPVEQDKPPAYTEVYDGAPPPPYSTDRQGRETPSTENSNNGSDTTRSIPDLPPSYEDCLNTTDNDNNKWPEVLEALMLEQARRERENPDLRQSDVLVTQLPAMRMPSMLMAQNYLFNRDRTIHTYPHSETPPDATNIASESEENALPKTDSQMKEEDQSVSPTVTNLLDPWAPQTYTSLPADVQNNTEEEVPGPSSFSSNTDSQIQQHNSTEETVSVSTEETVSVSTEDSMDLLSGSQTLTTSTGLSHLNDNVENSSNQSTGESSHSTQDYSIV